MSIKDIIKIIIFGFVIFVIVQFVKPYYNRYDLSVELKKAAAYGTKSSMEQTRKFIDRLMVEEEWNFKGDDFYINKDQNGTVTINIAYIDEVNIFGYTAMEMEFFVEVSQARKSGMW